MKYEGKTIWVTGASSGIGKAVCLELAKNKCTLILSGRNTDALGEIAELCSASGNKVQIIPFDLGNPESIQNAVTVALSNNSKIDCLYQFGGISQRSLAHKTDISIDRKIMEINFFGTVALAKAILPIMIRQGGGHLAITSSIVGKFGFPLRTSYSASKHALHGYFESLRAENKMNNISISIVIPGRIQTNISLNALTGQGEKYGIMDPGQSHGVRVEKTAKTIIKKLKKKRKEILVGGKEIFMVYIRKYLPSLYYNIVSKISET